MIRKKRAHEKIKLSCGTSINVTYWGNRMAPPCVLIHGLDNNARIWDSIATELCEKFLVYSIDIRGHGDSDWSNSENYNLTNLINDIEQVRTHFSLSDFILVGHSLGGRIATHYTANYLKHIKKLILIDMAPEIDHNILEKLKLDADNQPTNFSTFQNCYDYMQTIYPLSQQNLLYDFCHHFFSLQDTYYTSKTDPKFKSKMLQTSNPNGTPPILQDVKIWDVFPKISVPTLIIRGGFSAVLSNQIANKMAGTFPNASISLIERAGHAVMLDNPQQTAKAIFDFI